MPSLPAVSALVLASTLLAGLAHAQDPCPDFELPSGTRIATLNTTEGQVCLELLDGVGEAPQTVTNFVDYLEAGDYDDVIFHRSASGFVLQGGAFRIGNDGLEIVPTNAPVQNEPCTLPQGMTECDERGNVRGTVAMAKLGGDPDSATNQFFFNLADNRGGLPALDTQNGGFTVFANVLGTGMADVVDVIAAFPTESEARTYFLEPSIASALDSVPVDPVLTDLVSIGCFDPSPDGLVALIDPDRSSGTAGLPDPENTGLFFLSRGCGTQIPFGSFVENPGTMSCMDDDRLGLAVDDPATPSILDDPDTPEADEIQFSFTCQQTVDALADRAAFVGALLPTLVSIQSASVHRVPEPGTGLAGIAALAGLTILRRRSS